MQAALAQPLVGHMDPTLFPILERIAARLRDVFQTSNALTLAVSGTGTAGMEASIDTLVSPGDRIMVASSGYFAQRMADIARRAGADVVTVDAPWGGAVDPADVRRALRPGGVRLVAAVQVETSTGVLQPLDEMATIAHDHGALCLVDAVASLGGVDLPVDRWGIDACYTGSQKCLSAPPGLAPLTVNSAARDRAGRPPARSFYFDLELLQQYWAPPHTYHHTVPVPLMYALDEALRLIAEEGLGARVARHHRNAQALWAGLEAVGLSLLVPSAIRAPTVTTVVVPAGIDEATVRGRLLADYNIEIAGGLGPLRGKIWRIGLMGYSSRRDTVLLLLDALETILTGMGMRLPRGAAVGAAERALV